MQCSAGTKDVMEAGTATIEANDTIDTLASGLVAKRG